MSGTMNHNGSKISPYSVSPKYLHMVMFCFVLSCFEDSGFSVTRNSQDRCTVAGVIAWSSSAPEKNDNILNVDG